MRYFIIKKLSFNPKRGLYFSYTKSDTDGMEKRDHVFTFDLNNAYRFTDIDIAQSYTEHLSVVMCMEFEIQIVSSGESGITLA